VILGEVGIRGGEEEEEEKKEEKEGKGWGVGEGARTFLVEHFGDIHFMRTGEQPHQYSHQGHTRGRQIQRVIREKVEVDLPRTCHITYAFRIRTRFLNKDGDQSRSSLGANILCLAPRVRLGDHL
jgi:hypothetical protein